MNIKKLKSYINKSIIKITDQKIDFLFTTNRGDSFLKSDLLIKLAKVLKKSPKEIFKKLNLEFDNILFSEESGNLIISLKNPFLFNVNLDFKNYKENLIYLPSCKLNYFETLRLKALFFTQLFFRNALKLKTNLYIPDSKGLFKKFNFNNSSQFFNLEILNETNYTLDEVKLNNNFLILCFEENSSKIFKDSAKSNSHLSYLPKIYKGEIYSEKEIKLFYDHLNKYPLATSIYLTKEISSIDLDPFVVISNEQENLLAFIKNMYNLLAKLNIKSAENPSVEFEELEISINYKKLYLKYLKTKYSFNCSLSTGLSNSFLKESEDLLKSFQTIFNSPNFRQKIDSNSLNSVENQLITSIFGLIKLCNTHI